MKHCTLPISTTKARYKSLCYGNPLWQFWLNFYLALSFRIEKLKRNLIRKPLLFDSHFKRPEGFDKFFLNLFELSFKTHYQECFATATNFHLQDKCFSCHYSKTTILVLLPLSITHPSYHRPDMPSVLKSYKWKLKRTLSLQIRINDNLCDQKQLQGFELWVSIFID